MVMLAAGAWCDQPSALGVIAVTPPGARYMSVGRTSVTSAALNSAAKAAIALVLAVLLSASGPSCGVWAQGSGCPEACKAAFAACYKSTANRAACEMQLQHCLENCLLSKR